MLPELIAAAGFAVSVITAAAVWFPVRANLNKTHADTALAIASAHERAATADQTAFGLLQDKLAWMQEEIKSLRATVQEQAREIREWERKYYALLRDYDLSRGRPTGD